MELVEALRTNPAIRQFTDVPVSDEEVLELLDVARFAPSGGNRQPWRVAVIKDRTLRRQLADLCGPVWSEYMAISATGATPFAVTNPEFDHGELDPVANPVLDELESIPVVVVVAADLRSIAMMDSNQPRATLTGGASVYPFVHSLLLAARGRGLGGVMTTFLARAEEEARPLLGLPDSWAIASMVCIGHPAHRATRLRRRSVSEFTTIDRFDGTALGMTADLHDLSARYAAGADRRDADLFVSAFLPDGRLRRFDGEAAEEASSDRQGHAALREVPGLLARYAHTFHQLGQARYDVQGEAATGEVYCTASHVSAGIPAMVHVMHIRYLDTYRRVAGAWGIDERRVIVDWSEHRLVGEEA